MSEPTEKPQINLALSAILQDIEAIRKDKKNTAQNFNFRGIDDMYDHLHPVFAKHGVTCLPEEVKTTHGVVERGTGKSPFFTSAVDVKYRLTAVDGSFQLVSGAGYAFDMADKALGKALSQAHKYVLIQTFLIPINEIKDADWDPSVYPGDELREMNGAEERETSALERLIAETQAKADAAQNAQQRNRLNGIVAELKLKQQDLVSPTAPADNPDKKRDIESGSEDQPDPSELFGAVREAEAAPAKPAGDWKSVICHFGKADGPLLGKPVGSFNEKRLQWLRDALARNPSPTPKDHNLAWAVQEALASLIIPRTPAPQPDQEGLVY
jgi:hypothetical protein